MRMRTKIKCDIQSIKINRIAQPSYGNHIIYALVRNLLFDQTVNNKIFMHKFITIIVTECVCSNTCIQFWLNFELVLALARTMTYAMHCNVSDDGVCVCMAWPTDPFEDI